MAAAAPAASASDGLSKPQQSTPTKASWYFIDANRAYRGPVTKETLHFLFSTKAITPNTYVFCESSSTTRAWTRIRKMPELSEALNQPLPSSSAASAASADASSPAPAPAPKSSTRNPAALGAGGNGAGQPSASLAGDSSSTVATPRATVTMVPQAMKAQEGVKLSTYFKTTVVMTKAKKGGFFSKKPGKHQFGHPLPSVVIDGNGVPEGLSLLQECLARGKGELVEGIFRVSPASSTLKACRALAEAGKHKEINDMESVAHLIKLWFRELPDSIFAPELAPIVDGTLSHPQECVALCRRLPEINQKTIFWLLDLIADVCRHEADNRMTSQGLIIVFAPNLVGPPTTMDPYLSLELNKRCVAPRRPASPRSPHSPRPTRSHRDDAVLAQGGAIPGDAL